MARALAALAGVAVLAALAAGAASGERSQQGNLIVSLQGEVSPLRLPRDRPAPVSVHLAGSLRTADGSTLPRVTAMEFGLAGAGGLETRGLPVCRARRLRHTRDREALAACGPAQVGNGGVDAQVLVPHQAPFSFHAHLLVFNGRSPSGATVLLLHAYATAPPISVVFPFRLHRARGHFHNDLVANFPRGIGPWPSIARFEMTLSRRFAYRGARHSFLVASCPVPPRFTAGFLNVARVRFTLAGGRHIGTEIVRGCRAR